MGTIFFAAAAEVLALTETPIRIVCATTVNAIQAAIHSEAKRGFGVFGNVRVLSTEIAWKNEPKA